MRILVCGSRDWHAKGIVETMLEGFRLAYEPNLTIIEGGATGADEFARKWAVKNSGRVDWISMPADWHKYGKAAGAIRNKQMLDDGKPDLVLAFKSNFDDSLRRGGTENMVKQAKDYDVPVYLISKP